MRWTARPPSGQRSSNAIESVHASSRASSTLHGRSNATPCSARSFSFAGARYSRPSNMNRAPAMRFTHGAMT
jgi:hypothetical protein